MLRGEVKLSKSGRPLLAGSPEDQSRARRGVSSLSPPRGQEPLNYTPTPQVLGRVSCPPLGQSLPGGLCINLDLINLKN